MGTGGIVMVRVATDILAEMNQWWRGKVKVAFLTVGVNTLYHGCAILLSVIEGYLAQAGVKADCTSSGLFVPLPQVRQQSL